MCGIAGIYSFNAPVAGEGTIRRVTDAINHRGPDANGYYESGNIKLGHKRLSIIDLFECSNQPMSDNTGRYRIIFNGEIYNFTEIKARLTDYPFKSKGDTEVLLAAYITWGPACLDMCKGMFAFAVWDKKKKNCSWHATGSVLSHSITIIITTTSFLLQRSGHFLPQI